MLKKAKKYKKQETIVPEHQPVSGVHGHDIEGSFGFGGLIQFGHNEVKTKAAFTVSKAAFDGISITGVTADVTKEYLDCAADLKTEKSRNCEIEGDIAQILVTNGSSIVPEHKTKERIYSKAFTEVSFILARSMSLRDAHTVLNKVLHRTEGNNVMLRTYSDYVQRQDEQIGNAIKQGAEEILKNAGFD